MPKHEFEFEIYDQDDYRIIPVISGYDHEINLSINHETNWWIRLLHRDGEYHLDIHIGNHNAVLLDAKRDGLRGVDEDRLEVNSIGFYRADLLAKALGYVKEYQTRIIYAMEHLYQAANKA